MDQKRCTGLDCLRPSNHINVDKILAIRFELPNLFSLGHHPSTSLKYPILQTTCLLPAVFDATLLCCSDYAQIDRKLNTENSNRGKDTRVGGGREGRSCPPDHWRAGGLELTGYFATSFLPPPRVSYSRPAHRYRRRATSSRLQLFPSTPDRRRLCL